MKTSKQSGFSLVELMVVIVIVGLLSAVAIPSYRTHVLNGYRQQALVFVQDLVFKQQTYYNMNGRYGWLVELDAVGLGVEERHRDTVISDGAVIIDGRYRLTNHKTNNTFWYQLTAIGEQTADTGCTRIRVDNNWRPSDSLDLAQQLCS